MNALMSRIPMDAHKTLIHPGGCSTATRDASRRMLALHAHLQWSGPEHSDESRALLELSRCIQDLRRRQDAFTDRQTTLMKDVSNRVQTNVQQSKNIAKPRLSPKA